jgi:hypothetical protein
MNLVHQRSKELSGRDQFSADWAEAIFCQVFVYIQIKFYLASPFKNLQNGETVYTEGRGKMGRLFCLEICVFHE